MPQNPQLSFARILDAAANRASEGLRVVESVARMHLEDQHLTELAKQIRHELSSVVQSILVTRQIVARDSERDVGRFLRTEQEYQRKTPDSSAEENLENLPDPVASGFISIVSANLKRAQQALRTIEEFCKLDLEHELREPSPAPATNKAQQIEQLRYRCYRLEKQLTVILMGQKQFPEPCIYVLVDGIDWLQHSEVEQQEVDITAAMNTQFAAAIKSLAASGVDFIQLRDKQLSDRQLVSAGRLARMLLSDYDTGLIINDRPDLAIAIGAHGVHVGQDELPVATVRRIVGMQMLIGVSTHSQSQAIEAATAGADYIGVGPTFPSSTKAFNQHMGTELMRQVTQATSLPAFAIGGINLENVSQLSAVGCQRVAVSGIYRELVGQPPEAFLQMTRLLRQSLQASQPTNQ